MVSRKKLLVLAALWFPVVVLANYYIHTGSRVFDTIFNVAFLIPFCTIGLKWFDQ